MKRFTAEIPGVEQRESDLMVNFPNGARVRLYGAENYDRLRGTYSECLRLFQEELPFLSAEDKEWILGKSLAEVLKWPESPADARPWMRGGACGVLGR